MLGRAVAAAVGFAGGFLVRLKIVDGGFRVVVDFSSLRIVWNVEILEFSVDVGSVMLWVKFFSSIVPRVVVKPPTLTVNFFVLVSAECCGALVVGISSKVLLL